MQVVSRLFVCLVFTAVSFMQLTAQSIGYGASSAERSRYKLKNQKGEILVYSDQFNPNVITDHMPEALCEMLRQYRIQSAHNVPRYSNRLPGKAVLPLLKSVRTQEEPYNRSCPYYRYNNGTLSSDPCLSGCVATALEQVVSYWRHPAALKDTLHGWETDHYTISDVLPGTPIDWDNILVNYRDGNYTDVQAKAIADLTYYLGVGVHMNWGPGSSGASLSRAVDALYDAFDYKTIAFVQRSLYANPAWNRMLRHELECGRPIVYTGHNFGLNGHCFNIDGVDEEGFYHVNWGEDNYSCYVDLDYINPYEPIYDLTDMGMYTGLNYNSTALFMHPDDFEIDIWDTLSIDEALYSVEIDTVTFRRTPDAKGYVQADFSMTNTSSDSLNFTFEVMTYLPTDTAIFEQANYVALSTVNLAPGEHKIWPVLCRFSKTGDRLFAISADDETTPYVMPIHIDAGVAPVFEFAEPTVQFVRYTDAQQHDDLTARICFDVNNNAKSGIGCDVFTYCLFEEDNPDDYRHFNVLQINAGDTYAETVDFHYLKDGETYTFKLRYPWEVVKTLTFVYDASEAADGIAVPSADVNEEEGLYSSIRSRYGNRMYDLSGRSFSSASHPAVKPIGNALKGVYIKRGKKILAPQ